MGTDHNERILNEFILWNQCRYLVRIRCTSLKEDTLCNRKNETCLIDPIIVYLFQNGIIVAAEVIFFSVDIEKKNYVMWIR